MSEEPIRDTDVSPQEKLVQTIMGLLWACRPEPLPAAAGENGQGTPSVAQLGQWVATHLTADTIQASQITLDGQAVEQLLNALLEWGKHLKDFSCQQQARTTELEDTDEVGDQVSQPQMPGAACRPATELFTFGRFTLRHQGQEIAPPPRHGEALLKALLCQPRREAPFFRLAEQLWPEAEADQAMQYLYVASNAVRSTLPTSILLTHRQTQSYHLVGQDRLWIDADAALDLVAQAQALGRTTEQARPCLEEAMGYFRRGPFLAGIEQPWAYARRRAVETGKERALVWLVEAYRGQRQYEQAEALLSEVLSEDPLNENLLRCLMGVLHEAGMTHQALGMYEEFVRAVRKVGMEAAEATTALSVQLRKAPRVRDLPLFATIGADGAGERCVPMAASQQIEALLALLKPLALAAGTISAQEYEQFSAQSMRAALAQWCACLSFGFTVEGIRAE